MGLHSIQGRLSVPSEAVGLRDLAIVCNKLIQSTPRCPPFFWTTLQLDVHSSSDPHIDVGVMPDALIFAVGDFSGGTFWTLEPSKRSFGIRNKAVRFNPLHLHALDPATGDKLVVVAHTVEITSR